MTKIIYIVLISLVVTSCQQSFTKEEKQVICHEKTHTPFRVLQITNRKDSLFLRKQCKDINIRKNDKELTHLIKRMRATLAAEDGVGIAAIQIGIARNLFLFQRIDKPGKPVEAAINPRIINHSPDTFCFEGDGCLSIPGIFGSSSRYTWIEVEYLDENGIKKQEKLSGYSRNSDFTGVIFQHEFDHLQGVLFIDKLCE